MADVLNLNSRQAIKKYVKANNKVQFTSETQFDSMFNKALKSGVEKGEFTQPKGMTSEFSRHSTNFYNASHHLSDMVHVLLTRVSDRSLRTGEAGKEGGEARRRRQTCCAKGWHRRPRSHLSIANSVAEGT